MPDEDVLEQNIAEEPVEPSVQYCTFKFENELYGIEISYIQEIINIQKIFKAPAAPEYILGVINLRGNIVPVIDIKPILKKPSWKADVNSNIILINSGNMIVGIVVDQIGDVVFLTRSGIESVEIRRGEEMARYLIGISKLPDKVLALLDPKKIIDDTKLG